MKSQKGLYDGNKIVHQGDIWEIFKVKILTAAFYIYQ